jgi:peptide/nickel transport system permease protein
MRGVGPYVLTRIALMIPMLWVLLTLVFTILHVLPGDPCVAMLGGRNVTAEALADCRRTLGLDRPMAVQYVEYLGSVLRGDFGTSLRTGLPVLHELGLRLPATLELAAAGMAVAVLLGMGTGILAARRAGSWVDHALRALHVVSFALPVFWVGLVLLSAFAVALRWLPVGGRLDPVLGAAFRHITGFVLVDALLQGDLAVFASALRHLVLPALTLGFVLSGFVGRMTRASLLEVLRREYVTTARSKGLPERAVLFRHALRNALVPIVTVIGLQFALLVGGAILTETVFSWPGIARYLVEGIENRDFPAIQGTVVFIALLISATSLAVDVLYAWLDPRVRYG